MAFSLLFESNSLIIRAGKNTKTQMNNLQRPGRHVNGHTHAFVALTPFDLAEKKKKKKKKKVLT